MLRPKTNDRGFSIFAVTGALIIIGLLMMAALDLVQDHRRRATLSADHALAMQEADAALAVAECELAVATGTPAHGDCRATPNAARIAALNPVTLAGFVRGSCQPHGLCWPLAGQTAPALANLASTTGHTSAEEVSSTTTTESRQPKHRARYIIEPIPDTQPRQWVHAGTAPYPVLFRVTAVGFGTDEDVKVMLQTVYRPGVAP